MTGCMFYLRPGEKGRILVELDLLNILILK